MTKIPVHIAITERELMLQTAVLGATKTHELLELYDDMYGRLTEEEMEIVDILTDRLINVNISESELLDDVIEDLRNNPIGG